MNDSPSTADAGDPLEPGETNVAIACQGGGSHTAFTAGALQELFRTWNDDHELVGISGTSGGAICAVTAWDGLTSAGPDRAIRQLDEVWDDITPSSPMDYWMNVLQTIRTRIESRGGPMPQISPSVFPPVSENQTQLLELLESTVDFVTMDDRFETDSPDLIVGTVNVNTGEFRTFTNEDVTARAIVASAAVPDLFEPVEIDGQYHWDGLFSQNPPIMDLMSVDAARKPDELWIVQVNPQKHEGEPNSMAEISERRNELSGNISLNQELQFVERVNGWIDAGHLPTDEFSKTEIRRITLPEAVETSTKVDRRSGFVRDLMAMGESQVDAFRGAS